MLMDISVLQVTIRKCLREDVVHLKLVFYASVCEIPAQGTLPSDSTSPLFCTTLALQRRLKLDFIVRVDEDYIFVTGAIPLRANFPSFTPRCFSLVGDLPAIGFFCFS